MRPAAAGPGGQTDLQQLVQVVKLTGNIFTADNQANRIGVIVTDGGESVTLTGNVSGYIIRQDDATVVVTGAITGGNKAYIDLPVSAYTVPGQISIVIKVGTTTVGACCGQVSRSTTDTIVDPGHVIPSIAELLAKIADCEAATTAANAAAANANTKAGVADTAATNANTAAAKIDGMTVDSETGAASSSATATISEVSGHKHIHFSIPKGQDGRDGIIAQIDMGLFTMHINNDGDLICTYSTDPPALSINSDGDLIYTV